MRFSERFFIGGDFMNDKKISPPNTQEILEYSLADFDKSIVDLGISLANTAAKETNADYKFKLVEAIVKLRGALPPIYLKR